MGGEIGGHELFLGAVVDALPSMVFVKDAKNEYRFVMFNKAGLKLLGLSSSELIGKNDYDFFPEEQADFFRQKDEEVFNATGIVDVPEEKIDTPNGTRILHTRKIGLKDEEGNPQWLVGISEDITAEVLNTRRLNTFLNTSGLGLWEWNLETGELYWNKRWFEMLDYAEGEIEVSAENFNQLTHPEDSERVWSLVNEILEGKVHHQEFTFRMRAKGGRWVSVLSRCQAAKVDPKNGKALIVSGTHFDLTKMLSLQEEARVKEAQLVKSSRLAQIGELAAGVGHEINNPLTVAMGTVERMQKGKGNNEDSLMKLQAAHDRIHRIVSSMRSFSHFDEEKEQSCSPSDALKETLNFYAESLIHAGIDLSIPAAIDGRVPIGKSKLGQVFLNFLSNSRFAVQEQEMARIAIDHSVQNNFYTIHFSDNGRGIKKEHLDLIFDPFFTTKPVGQGTGIGLGLCKKFIDEAGGRIEVESTVGEGSTFSIVLPLVM